MIATAVSFVVGLVSGILFLIPCIGWIAGWMILGLSGVWIGTVYAHLFGQVGASPPGDALIPTA